MDYIYGKLNYEVQKVEYEGASTSTAQTTVDNETRTIKVDAILPPAVEYIGVNTPTAETSVNNETHTISVNALFPTIEDGAKYLQVLDVDNDVIERIALVIINGQPVLQIQ